MLQPADCYGFMAAGCLHLVEVMFVHSVFDCCQVTTLLTMVNHAKKAKGIHSFESL